MVYLCVTSVGFYGLNLNRILSFSIVLGDCRLNNLGIVDSLNVISNKFVGFYICYIYIVLIDNYI